MINRRLYLFVLYIIFPVILFAQQTNGYFHMKGNLGSNVHITADIQQEGNRIEGHYSYILHLKDSLKLSPIVALYGHIDKHHYTILKRVSSGDTALTGLFFAPLFSGNWYGPDSAVLAFNWKEAWPSGTLPLDVYYIHSEKELIPKAAGSPHAEIELTMLYPKNNTSFPERIKDSVKKNIQYQFIGEYHPAVAPQNLLEQTENEFYTSFRELNTHWKTNRKLGFNTAERIQTTIIYNAHNLLCLQYRKRGYAGRGNPLIRYAYDMIDLRNGQKITPENLFLPGTKTEIIRLINQKIRNDNGLPDSADLKKIGFFVKKVPFSNNMYFSGNGIVFVYNVYDVAPPTLGIQKVFLPFSQIKKFIKPDTVIYPFCQ